MSQPRPGFAAARALYPIFVRWSPWSGTRLVFSGVLGHAISGWAADPLLFGASGLHVVQATRVAARANLGTGWPGCRPPGPSGLHPRREAFVFGSSDAAACGGGVGGPKLTSIRADARRSAVPDRVKLEHTVPRITVGKLRRAAVHKRMTTMTER